MSHAQQRCRVCYRVAEHCSCRWLCAAAAIGAAWALLGEPLHAAGPMEGVELVVEAARHSVNDLAPYVVQVQPIGVAGSASGLEATGPTSGVFVPRYGCVVTSTYRVAGAAGLVVFCDDGSRSSATLAAVDHNRQIAVLRLTTPPTEPPGPLPTIESRDDLRVGQTIVAVGRVYRSDEPNMAVGVLSAKRRLFGRAIQTDAAVSPANYGGPAIDLAGRVVGVLTPLTPEAGGAASGEGWYDSGIGFAVPWPAIAERLPKLLSGEDIHRGLLGLSL
ncbi:MAG: S1C family serine protease, partial [Planctomycetota bacterium]